jgi:hypothetical protein
LIMKFSSAAQVFVIKVFQYTFNNKKIMKRVKRCNLQSTIANKHENVFITVNLYFSNPWKWNSFDIVLYWTRLVSGF